MVEGPGCKLKGLKLKKRVKGQIIRAVSGNVIENRKAKRGDVSPFERLIGLACQDVLTLGKELFALLENDVCLRVHFLMSGSVRYNDEPKDFGEGKTEEPRLKLHMSKDDVGFFDCAVELRSCAECIEKYDQLIDLDICSPTFDAKRASLTIREHPNRLVCDVILDQLVLPGVGNIIKNEALYDAGINPTSKVKELSEELISQLVKMNRDFTNIFYKCRKEGKDLRKHMRVYKKESCPECRGKITKCKIGEYERLTFFCRSCQTNTIKTAQKLAKRNSLLGWVQASKHQVPWNCSLCTLENKPANSNCSACFSPKHALAATGTTPSFARTIQAPAERLESPLDLSVNTNTTACGSTFAGSCTLVSSSASCEEVGEMHRNSSKRSLESTPVESVKIGKYTFKRMSSDGIGNPSPTLMQQMDFNSPLSRPVIQGSNQEKTSPIVTSFGGKQPKNLFSNSQSEVLPHKKNEEQVLCSGHKKPARKSVVEKKNENRGRVFYICSFPQFKQCKFFKWADSHHPLCGHGKIAVVRTVMKMNANNGREFYCCSNPKPKQCDFFEWVEKRS